MGDGKKNSIRIFDQKKINMSEIKDLLTVNDYCAGFNLAPLHPQVSVVDLSAGTWENWQKIEAVRYHFYGIFLKQGQNCILKYGRKNYDYQDGTLVFVGLEQLVNIAHINYDIQPSGHALLFHPSFLLGSNLGKAIHNYSFFSYELHEALHLSQKERQIVLDCFDKIHYELSQNMDKHTKHLVLSNIELFLGYCNRFYDRQFLTRDIVNSNIIEQFKSSLHDYLKTGKARELGSPTVSYFAKEQHLSANYFGDLIKKETGKSAQELIQSKIIEMAKTQIIHPDKTVSEVAYELGFKYPQHFSRMFKKETGVAPSAFRSMN